MKYLNLLLVISLVTFFSCKEQEIIENNILSSNSNLEVSYLSFSSQSDFDKYIAKISNNNKVDLKSSNLHSHPKKFYSLADELNQYDSDLLKGSSDASIDFDDLFKAQIFDELIPDDILKNALDTLARVKIGEEIYQITEFGTFVYKPEDYNSFKKLCDDFTENYKLYTSKLDNNTYVYNDIKLIDSYGCIANNNLNSAIDDLLSDIAIDYKTNKEENLNGEGVLKSSSSKINSSYTSKYNLTTHNAARHTIVGKGVDKLSGKWYDRKIGSRRRVRCKLFSVDYQFYKNSGFKVKFQIQQVKTVTVGFGRWKKKITIKGLWVKANAPKLAIGVDHFIGYTEMTTFGLDKFYSDTYDHVGDYSKKWSNQLVKMVYAGALKEPTNLVKGWVSDRINIFNATAQIKLFGETYNLSDYEKKAIEEAFDAARNEGISELKKKTNSFVYRQLTGNVEKPKAMFVPGGANHSNREYLALEGVNTYNNDNKVTTGFGGPSFGLKVSWGSSSGWNMPGGFTPNKFVVEEAYVFGAVYYDNKWTGIRLYLD